MVKTQKFDLDTDTTLGGNNASDYIAPSQKAIKDYVDNHSGGGGITVDGELSTTSENPVQNRVITQALADSTDVFWAEYGVTAYNDIKDALDANKIVVCNVTESVSGIPFVYTYRASRIGKDTTYIPNNAITFDCMSGVVNKILVCDTSSNWTSHSYRFAQESNVPTESTVSGWGFTKNTGTVTSVNNTSPDANGNVTLSIPTVPTNISAFNNDSGYITGITSSNVTTALGYTPYNSSNPSGYISSSSSYVASSRFDGQWVFSKSLLSTSTAVNTYEISLADYLPNDGYIYEVLLNGYINRKGNGNSALMLSSDIIDTQFTTFSICYANNGNADGSAVTIPVGSTRKIKLRIDNQATSWTYLYALAYRRVGTNT